MKITMFVTEDAMQFNLTPESPHETEMMEILNKFTGTVSIKHGSKVDRCQGGWLRDFGEDSSTAITIDKVGVK
jgi:hypothetical protein